jgi:hypothetical protein
MSKWDFIKLKASAQQKKQSRESTEWDRILASYSSHKGLVSRIYRELKEFKPPKINTPMKKNAQELHRECSKEEVQMAKK